MDAYQVGLMLACRAAGFQKEASLGSLLRRAGGALKANKRNIAYGVGVPIAAGAAGLAGYGYATDPAPGMVPLRIPVEPQVMGHTFI